MPLIEKKLKKIMDQYLTKEMIENKLIMEFIEDLKEPHSREGLIEKWEEKLQL